MSFFFLRVLCRIPLRGLFLLPSVVDPGPDLVLLGNADPAQAQLHVIIVWLKDKKISPF